MTTLICVSFPARSTHFIESLLSRFRDDLDSMSAWLTRLHMLKNSCALKTTIAYSFTTDCFNARLI